MELVTTGTDQIGEVWYWDSSLARRACWDWAELVMFKTDWRRERLYYFSDMPRCRWWDRMDWEMTETDLMGEMCYYPPGPAGYSRIRSVGVRNGASRQHTRKRSFYQMAQICMIEPGWREKAFVEHVLQIVEFSSRVHSCNARCKERWGDLHWFFERHAHRKPAKSDVIGSEVTLTVLELQMLRSKTIPLCFVSGTLHIQLCINMFWRKAKNIEG